MPSTCWGRMTIKRHLEGSAWVYDDLAVEVARTDWALFCGGFNLAAFDDYLEEPGWDTPKAIENRKLLMRRRAQALDAHRTGNHEAANAWINFLHAAMRASQHGEWLLPLAQQGRKHSAVQSRRRLGKKATDSQDDLDRNVRVRNFHARLVAAGEHDPTSRTGIEFNLSTRQTRRILRP